MESQSLAVAKSLRGILGLLVFFNFSTDGTLRSASTRVDNYSVDATAAKRGSCRGDDSDLPSQCLYW